jgi:DNA-binding response OmpR family regulator
MSAKPVRILDPFSITVDPSEVMRILYVEDEWQYFDLIKEKLIAWGCTVDAVRYPDETIPLLNKNKYEVFISDFLFPVEHPNGGDFIKTYKSLLGAADIVILTAVPDSVDPEIKENDEITVVDKVDLYLLEEHIKYVYDRVKEKTEKRKSNLFFEDISAKYPLAEVELESLQNELIEELKKSDEVLTKLVSYGNEQFSVSELIDQIKQGSDVGQELVMALHDLKNLPDNIDELYTN